MSNEVTGMGPWILPGKPVPEKKGDQTLEGCTIQIDGHHGTGDPMWERHGLSEPGRCLALATIPGHG